MKNRTCGGVVICALISFLLTGVVSATTINSVTITGTQLTITGSGFSGTPLIVSFSGKSIPIVSSSSTQIIATLSPVPAPGSYRLGVQSGRAVAVTTFAISMPSAVATVALFNQTAPIPKTVLWTTPTDGLYRITMYIAETVPGGTGGSWSGLVVWNDLVTIGNNLQANIGCMTLNERLVTGPARLLAGQPITYEVDSNNASGTYEVVITLEQLTNQ